MGIDSYANLPRLGQAAHDAIEFSASLQMPEYDFEVTHFLDLGATRREIRDRVTELLAGEAELKLLYFSGHGIANDAEVFLAMVDSTGEEPGIGLSWLREKIVSAKGTVLVILDCCHAGAGQVREVRALRALDEADIERSLGTLPQGKVLLAACGAREVATETESTGHGIFTFHLLQGMLGAAANPAGLVTPMGLYDYAAQMLAEDGRQRPILKGEVVGLVVLGGGFPSPYPVTAEDTGRSPELLDALEGEANEHLDHYLSFFSGVNASHEEWKASGFADCCRLLEPVLRWFNRHAREYPELLSRPGFRQANSEVRARLAHLGALSEGVRTDEGEVLENLGAGAFGTVWKIQAPEGESLAYKVYHPNELDIREKVARFERGYRAMSILDHPHIVKVRRLTASPLGFYMDYIGGPNLRQFAGSLDEPEDILVLLIEIAETLQHAHGRRVIHRDVKPENIVLAPGEGRWAPYLTDFDLAWFSTATQVTREAFGALFYAAPEQLAKPSSGAAHSPTTDVFSFGQLCYFAVAGSDPVPFGAADNSRGLEQLVAGWGGAMEAAASFVRLYDRCTRQDPTERPQSFREIIDELHAAYQLVHGLDPREPVSDDRFLSELLFALAGLSDERRLSETTFRSLSGRTTVTVESLSHVGRRVKVSAQLVQEYLTVGGADSYSRARRILNERLTTAFEAYPGVSHRPGSHPVFSTHLDIRGIEPNASGVDACRRAISRAIDTLESV